MWVVFGFRTLCHTGSKPHRASKQGCRCPTAMHRVALSEVSCEFCENKLGVTYVVAPDARNQYKAAVLEFQLPKHPELNCKLKNGRGFRV